MMKSGIDQQALIDQFANASAQQTAQLRSTVFNATLQALQGRELSLKNIRSVLGTVAQAAGTGAAKNPLLGSLDAQTLLDNAVSGMDDAMLKAVEANRMALQQFVDKGVDLRETQLKKALAEMDKFGRELHRAGLGRAAGPVRRDAPGHGRQGAGQEVGGGPPPKWGRAQPRLWGVCLAPV